MTAATAQQRHQIRVLRLSHSPSSFRQGDPARLRAGFAAIVAKMAVIPLLASFGLCGAAHSSARLDQAYFPVSVLVSSISTHYVAANGNDGGPGTADQPWATLNHAAEQAKPGDTILVRGGHYVLKSQVQLRNSGRPHAWITFLGSPGEKVVLDAAQVPRSSLVKNGLDNGALQIEDAAYVRVIDLTVVNSHDAGITVRDSSNIDLINNSTNATFSSGIAVWDTVDDDGKTEHVRVIGNTITRATTWDLAPPDLPRRGEPPHEALSIGGAIDFEVAYNHIYDSDKEGIDIKGTSKRGKVHHNVVNNLARQGLYIDAWFGAIRDIAIYANVLYGCHGAGLALSVENGTFVADIDIHDNLIFDNDGSGLYFSRWGVNHERRNIQIHNNIFYHNGYGTPAKGQTYYWMTGGLYLYSANLRDITVSDNIFSGNRGFQIGYSGLYLNDYPSWSAAASAKNIQIMGNLIGGQNNVGTPIESGGDPHDQVKIYAVNGRRPIFGNPLFKDSANGDFALRPGSPAPAARIIPVGAADLWWKQSFPPRLFRSNFGRLN
jgi:parallel beta-helix repeat protein